MLNKLQNLDKTKYRDMPSCSIKLMSTCDMHIGEEAHTRVEVFPYLLKLPAYFCLTYWYQWDNMESSITIIRVLFELVN